MHDLKDLKRGDIVRNVGSAESYVVDGRYGDCVIAVRTVTLTNPREWEKVNPISHDDEPEYFMTINEVARMFRVTGVTIGNWLRDGQLPGFKVGRNWRVSSRDLDHLTRR